MIERIDPKDLIGLQPLPSSRSSCPEGGLDFHSILKGKMEELRPLEKIFLEYLTRVTESVLSEEPSEGDLFLSSPLSLNLPVQPLPMNLQPGRKASNYLQGKQDFDPIVKEAARKYGVEPPLIMAVIQAESAGDPLAVSRAGAQGLMQLMPETAAKLGVNDPFDPAQNIMAGTRYLRQLLDRYRGDVRLALASYNWGIGNLENQPGAMPKETKNYIATVESYYRSFAKA
jgi:soluble lytic murein transglycosylase-like protein